MRRTARQLAGKIGAHERQADLEHAVSGARRRHPPRQPGAILALRERAGQDVTGLDQRHVGVDLALQLRGEPVVDERSDHRRRGGAGNTRGGEPVDRGVERRERGHRDSPVRGLREREPGRILQCLDRPGPPGQDRAVRIHDREQVRLRREHRSRGAQGALVWPRRRLPISAAYGLDQVRHHGDGAWGEAGVEQVELAPQGVARGGDPRPHGVFSGLGDGQRDPGQVEGEGDRNHNREDPDPGSHRSTAIATSQCGQTLVQAPESASSTSFLLISRRTETA